MGDSTSRTPGTHTGPTKRRLTQCQSVRTKKPVRIPVRSTRPRRCGWSNNYIALARVFIATVIGLLSVREPDNHTYRYQNRPLFSRGEASQRRRLPQTIVICPGCGIWPCQGWAPCPREQDAPELEPLMIGDKTLEDNSCSRCAHGKQYGWWITRFCKSTCARCKGTRNEPFGSCPSCAGKTSMRAMCSEFHHKPWNVYPMPQRENAIWVMCQMRRHKERAWSMWALPFDHRRVSGSRWQ